MSHYTVGYHDNNQEHYEICEYAKDAYEAIEHSKEDVSYLRDHPHFIDYCNLNPKEVDNMINFRMAGIPMGC